MSPATLTVRPGHPDFLDLPWERSLVEWDTERIVHLPQGISRHEVRFVTYPEGIYAVKELPQRAARQDYSVLRALESKQAPAVMPVGLVEERHADRHAEAAAALITRYVDFSFSYRELLEGPGFGARRNQMLDAFAGLLVELHLSGCFWGDCSLSNVLYRYDAEAIETIMVDAETASVHDELTPGQREEDVAIMIGNVAGGMADIAASQGVDVDAADLALGEDIASRYEALWTELSRVESIGPHEHYLITARVQRLNALGFDVEEVNLVPTVQGSRVDLTVKVGGRNYHSTRLKELTGVEASEHQARQILSDLHYYQAADDALSPTGKALMAVRWRVDHLEPLLQRLRGVEGVSDPIQSYCDLLHHRYILSAAAGRDVGTEAAFEDWVAAGRPGYPLGE